MAHIVIRAAGQTIWSDVEKQLIQLPNLSDKSNTIRELHEMRKHENL